MRNLLYLLHFLTRTYMRRINLSPLPPLLVATTVAWGATGVAGAVLLLAVAGCAMCAKKPTVDLGRPTHSYVVVSVCISLSLSFALPTPFAHIILLSTVGKSTAPLAPSPSANGEKMVALCNGLLHQQHACAHVCIYLYIYNICVCACG